MYPLRKTSVLLGRKEAGQEVLRAIGVDLVELRLKSVRLTTDKMHGRAGSGDTVIQGRAKGW